jgi:ankyrin repeat protein
MAIKSLYDERRRKAVLAAVRRGENIFSGKTRPGQDEGGQDVHSMPLSNEFGAVKFEPNPPAFKIGKTKYSPDEYLLLAIQYGDLSAAMEAVDNGANVNRKYTHFLKPVHPPVGEDCSRTIIPSVRTPLQYAKKLGKAEVVEFLKRNGATE